MNSKPKCSVIMTVFNRTEYIEEALNSLEKQTIGRDFFEVLLISNVEIRLTRKFDISLTIISSKNLTLAGKLAEGILLATYEVITFIEDDDLYCDDRLSNVLLAFSKNCRLTYYHNKSNHFKNFGKCGEYGNYNQSNATPKNLNILDVEAEDARVYSMKYLNKNRADFNLSSMALSKSFIYKYVDQLSELGTRYVDSFIFYVALFKGNFVMIDHRVLTLNRVHHLNASQSVEVNSESYKNMTYSKEMEKVIVSLKNLGIFENKLIQKWVGTRGFDDAIKSRSLSRRHALITMVNLIKLYKIDFIRSDVTKKAILYILSWKLMNSMLRVFHST